MRTLTQKKNLELATRGSNVFNDKSTGCLLSKTPVQPLVDEVQANACYNIRCDGHHEKSNHRIHLLSRAKQGEYDYKIHFTKIFSIKQTACKKFHAVINFKRQLVNYMLQS